MNSVVHFEMPAENRERVCKFYEEAFGWKMIKYGPEMGNYIVAQTGEVDKDNMLVKKGMINGGFYEKNADAPYPSVVLGTDDIAKTIEKIKKAGGKMINDKPVDIPGVGLYASFIDTEGNRASLMQPHDM